MYRITFVVDALRRPNGPRGAPQDMRLGQKAAHTMIGALMLLDQDWLRAHPDAPSAEEAVRTGRVRIEETRIGTEDLRDVASMLAPVNEGGGYGTVQDIECWLAAERRLIRKDSSIWPRLEHLPTSHRIRFNINLFKGRFDRELSHRALQTLLVALVAIDCDYLRAHPETPGVYDGLVRYEEEPIGQEDWQDIPTCLRMGVGDCEDIACWLSAQYLVRLGLDVWPTFTYKLRSNGSYLYHITNLLPDGRIEDPSRRLGMR